MGLCTSDSYLSLRRKSAKDMQRIAHGMRPRDEFAKSGLATKGQQHHGRNNGRRRSHRRR
jgi:hypothetical protein